VLVDRVRPAREAVAMISGASRGISKAVALHLHQFGWQVSLGARTPDAIDPTLAGERVLRSTL
jgi:NADP-dependent 3-hydroxy acid dehydrogenase YdfG